MKGKNGGLIELCQYITNCGVTERDPIMLMHEYLASSSGIASNWKTVYACVGNDLQAHIFTAGKTNPGLAPAPGKTVADTYQTRRKNPEVWAGLFAGSRFGERAKGTHIYSQFLSALGGVGDKLRDDQRVMLFHLMGAPNLEAVMGENVLGLADVLHPKTRNGLCASLRSLAASLKVDPLIRAGLADNIALDIAMMIKDCAYPVLEGQTWASIRDYVTPVRASPQPRRPVYPGFIDHRRAANVNPSISSAIDTADMSAAMAAGGPRRGKEWTAETEDEFLQNTFWRDFKRANGLPSYHPAREAVHLYLSGKAKPDSITVDEYDHAMVVESILPYCDIGAVAGDQTTTAFKQELYNKTGETSRTFERNWPTERVIKSLLTVSHPAKMAERRRQPLDENFIRALLPVTN